MNEQIDGILTKKILRLLEITEQQKNELIEGLERWQQDPSASMPIILESYTKWHTEPPTQDGHYWLCHENGEVFIEWWDSSVNRFQDAATVGDFEGLHIEYIDNWKAWAEIEKPEPPTVKSELDSERRYDIRKQHSFRANNG